MKKIMYLLLPALLLVACQKQGTIPNADALTALEKTFVENDTGWCEVRYVNTEEAPPASEAVGDVVFLIDFDGYDLQANSSWGNASPVTFLPSYVNDDYSKSEIVSRVIDDFDMFGMWVTTDEDKWQSADVRKRFRVVVSPTTTGISTLRAGLALSNFYGTTLNNSNPAAFVFTGRVNNDRKLVAEIISHEVGHVFGLSHQSRYIGCTRIEEFHTGFSNPSWPHLGFRLIMGDALNSGSGMSNWYIGIDQWSCSSQQDDVATIISKVGFKPDEASSDFSNPKSIFYSSKIAPGSPRPGTLGHANDEDMWVASHNMYVTVKSVLFDPETGGNFLYGNMDLRVDMYNASQQWVATFDDPESANVVNMYLPQGWYIKISGTSTNPAMPRQFMTGKYGVQPMSGIFTP